MKKKLVLLFAFFLALQSTAFAYEDGRTDKGVWGRLGMVESRGLLNLIGLPCEFIRTGAVEKTVHPKAWPVTYIPKLFYNVFGRASSAANDVLVYPFIAPFTNDLSPMTEPLGLSTYPWEWSEYQ